MRTAVYWIDTLPEQTIGQALDEAVARFGGDKEAYVFPTLRLTLSEVQSRSDHAAKAFLALGVKHGDRVAVWMANHPEWIDVYFGLLKIGAIIVPLNSRFKPPELAFCLRNSGARALIFKQEVTETGKDYSLMLLSVLPELPGAPPGDLHSLAAPDLHTVIDLAETPVAGALGVGALLALGDRVSDEALAAAKCLSAPTDDAIVQYTSGTTSFPKGARLAHRGMLRGASETLSWMKTHAGDAFFSVQPFYHAGGSVTTILAPVVAGCRTITLTYFDANLALEVMEAERATVTVGHQPHFIEYMNHPSFVHRDLCIERMLVIAPPEVFHMVRETFGVEQLVSGYGMTETHMFGTATSLDTDSTDVRFNTNGRPNVGVELQIRDADGVVLGVDEEGEIFMRVPYPMLGYLNAPEQTAEVLVDGGWYRTGDKGLVRADGCLRLLGRVRDMIRVGGENLSAAEVEACLLAHPAVKQAVAVATPDPRLGEVVASYVEFKAGETAAAAELIEHCRSRLASYKVPRSVHFVTEWPMSGSGKIQKRLLIPSKQGTG